MTRDETVSFLDDAEDEHTLFLLALKDEQPRRGDPVPGLIKDLRSDPYDLRATFLLTQKLGLQADIAHFAPDATLNEMEPRLRSLGKKWNAHASALAQAFERVLLLSFLDLGKRQPDGPLQPPMLTGRAIRIEFGRFPSTRSIDSHDRRQPSRRRLHQAHGFGSGPHFYRARARTCPWP